MVTAVISICFLPFPYGAGNGWAKDDMVLIPAGSFTMGTNLLASEWPPHKVYVDGFYMDKYEVTNGDYYKFLEAKDYYLPLFWNSVAYHSGLRFKNRPVIGVSWYGACEYCKWKGKRLPSEAEWEKAARGGLKGKKYPWGNVPDMIFANFASAKGSKVVGSYKPNGSGLYDMAGNVWEYCQDYYQMYYYRSLKKGKETKNPKGPDEGTYRVVRGGSWYFGYHQTRVGYRGWFTPAEGSFDVGFRCVRSK